MALHITSPIDNKTIQKLRAGDQVLISGIVYTARDAAHKRIVECLNKGEKPPFDIGGQTIYYMGPSPPNQAMLSEQPDRPPAVEWMPMRPD